jgi:carbamoylphosphate synthase small subunit
MEFQLIRCLTATERINHPVKNLISGKGEITSQNHGFAVNKEEAI